MATRAMNQAVDKLIKLGGVAKASAFTRLELNRLKWLAAHGGRVAKMRDGRWEVTAEGWMTENDARDIKIAESEDWDWRAMDAVRAA